MEKDRPSVSDIGSTQLRPWRFWRQYRRRVSGLGLQGKLILCFMALLTTALGASCWLFASQSRARLNELIGEQARQLSQALALASKPAISAGKLDELTYIGQDLLHSHNILFVAFLDLGGKPLAMASRDPDFAIADATKLLHDTRFLMQVREVQSALFGKHLQVVAPVIQVGEPNGARMLGYVAIGVSTAREQIQLDRISYMIIGIGCIIAMLTLPMAYLLVHRIFQPIRELVAATHRIAAGDLKAKVAIDRADVIGTLARSFNEMMQTIRRQQEDLAAANWDLEQKVQLRTGELQAANKRLSVEIAEKEDFLRAVSHDLNAPLRNISGMATMLLMKHRAVFDEDIVHRLERIQKNVEVETDLIGELLELSRIKTRRHKMDFIETAGLVHDLADVFEDDLHRRNIALTIDTPLPVIHGEKARLRQVFQNLIDNAIKYMGDRPSGEIHVGCVVREGEAEFYVRDTGIGIEPDDLDKVFFVFRRGKNTHVQHVAGKGIGLASVKSIIETYNGSIWVESRFGEGSTFRFTINGQFVGRAGAAVGNAAGAESASMLNSEQGE